jgi:hypothetical protein
MAVVNLRPNMSRRRVVLIASFSCLVGIAAGAVGASWYWERFYSEFIKYALAQRTQADIVTRVYVFQHIRAAEVQDATSNLENVLDSDFIAAAALARDGTKFNDNTRRAVEIERRSRIVSGYEPGTPGVKKAVQEAFHLLTDESTK